MKQWRAGFYLGRKKMFWWWGGMNKGRIGGGCGREIPVLCVGS